MHGLDTTLIIWVLGGSAVIGILGIVGVSYLIHRFFKNRRNK